MSFSVISCVSNFQRVYICELFVFLEEIKKNAVLSHILIGNHWPPPLLIFDSVKTKGVSFLISAGSPNPGGALLTFTQPNLSIRNGKKSFILYFYKK